MDRTPALPIASRVCGTRGSGCTRCSIRPWVRSVRILNSMPSLPVYGLCAHQVRVKSNPEWASRVARAERRLPYRQPSDLVPVQLLVPVQPLVRHCPSMHPSRFRPDHSQTKFVIIIRESESRVALLPNRLRAITLSSLTEACCNRKLTFELDSVYHS